MEISPVEVTLMTRSRGRGELGGRVELSESWEQQRKCGWWVVVGGGIRWFSLRSDLDSVAFSYLYSFLDLSKSTLSIMTSESNCRAGGSATLHCCWCQLLYCRDSQLYWVCGRISPAKTSHWKFPYSVSAHIFVSCDQASSKMKMIILIKHFYTIVKLFLCLLISILTWWLRWTSLSCWYWQHCKFQSVW